MASTLPLRKMAKSNIVIDHPIPFFCPKSLVEYRSQELMPFLEAQHRLCLDDMRIETGDKSRRLDQEVLADLCAIMPPEAHEDTSLKLPFWAKGDVVLQQILRTRSTPIMAGHPAKSSSPLCSRTSVDAQEGITVCNFTSTAATSAGTGSESGVKPCQIMRSTILER